ncbi:hypothetical protein E4M02_04320 [Brevundimonas sp. S30B]|uniref:hypothetical protein n=1 Tax=unclassified Brevundimonas TaxID=2622653 RepID=UPI0010715F3F|nr:MULTISPECIES: hypothetical protein [unclassified Brevundimonas]QBX36904.1 hypothetical protein E4M01_03495 [Brevundimonas sp. MF30-B]TFW04301.1 hypothetical protein E4M02_04320 [Brevundimonas sp. S30B]
MGSFNIKAGGAWRPAKAVHVNASGAWRAAKEVWVRSGGTWRKAWVNAPELTIIPMDAYGTGYSAEHSPGWATVDFYINSVSGGTTPYSYQWSYTDTGFGGVTVVGSSTATSFTLRLSGQAGTTSSGNVWCTVTDANGNSTDSALAYYQLEIEYGGGGGGPIIIG